MKKKPIEHNSRPGQLDVTAIDEGKVVMSVPHPGFIVFTVEQARGLAHALLEKANAAEAQVRRWA